jgi:heme-degrading monooxygenase HmoA
MTTIGMHYEVIPGKEEDFKRGFAGVLGVLKTFPGHVESRLFEDVNLPGSYMIWSQWSSKSDFEKFLKSPEFASATSWGKTQILRARPQHKVYTND